MIKVLLLEDDFTLSKEITEYLASKEIVCDTVYDGELFLIQAKNQKFDFYLLDINVPKLNGLDVCSKIRETDKSTPILMLTAFGEIDEKVKAFKNGADDYLVKPFHLKELHMRILALNRRKDSAQSADDIIEIEDLKIDKVNKKVSRAGSEIPLTPKEFKLLLILANAKGRTISKQQIADELWDYHIETNQNTIEVYINFLRNKIDKNSENKLIHTRVGYGYFLDTGR